MKNFIFILFLFFSCATQVPRYVFQKTYAVADSVIVIQDINKQCDKYHVVQIPLHEWITNEYTTDTINIIQKTISHEFAYVFIYTKFIYPSKTYYEFKVRYLGKEK